MFVGITADRVEKTAADLGDALRKKEEAEKRADDE